MFDTERFVADCRAALEVDRGGGRAMREVVARVVSDPAHLMRALGEPRRAGLNVLHHAPDLTVLNLVWGPGMSVMPHNHRTMAVIGIYTGREENAFCAASAAQVATGRAAASRPPGARPSPSASARCSAATSSTR